MEIVILTNFFNHHQKPLSDELYNITKGKSWFIETKPIIEERKKMGWKSEEMPYLKKCYNYHDSTSQDTRECVDLVSSADVVITGSAPEFLLKERIKEGKLILRWSERPFKKEASFLKRIYFALRGRIYNPKNKPIYLLCASAYTANDYVKAGVLKNKMYKWGYFPETKYYEKVGEIIKNKNKKRIVWCGRFIDWKHPDDLITIAERLKKDSVEFEICFVGCGEMENHLRKMTKEKELMKEIIFLGVKSPEEVREYMETSGIYVFTSDRQEGWGAVLNEAMNSACAVVASHAIGATQYLIEKGENGLIYESQNIDMLYKNVKWLLENPEEQERLALSAYKTITEEWNAEEAARRLVILCEKILGGDKSPDLFASGPCSRAVVMNENYY